MNRLRCKWLFVGNKWQILSLDFTLDLFHPLTDSVVELASAWKKKLFFFFLCNFDYRKLQPLDYVATSLASHYIFTSCAWRNLGLHTRKSAGIWWFTFEFIVFQDGSKRASSCKCCYYCCCSSSCCCCKFLMIILTINNIFKLLLVPLFNEWNVNDSSSYVESLVDFSVVVMLRD